MEYFREPTTVVLLSDVTKEVNNFLLKQKHDKNKAKLKKLRYSNENMAHEMRTPLGSIIVIIDLLLGLFPNHSELERVTNYCKQIKFQAQLLLHFVNDMLDYRLIKNDAFEKNIVTFDPKTAIKNVVDIFVE